MGKSPREGAKRPNPEAEEATRLASGAKAKH